MRGCPNRLFFCHRTLLHTRRLYPLAHRVQFRPPITPPAFPALLPRRPSDGSMPWPYPSICADSGWHPLPVPCSLFPPGARCGFLAPPCPLRAPGAAVPRACRLQAPAATVPRCGLVIRAPAAGSCRRRATRRDPANNRCWAPPPGAANETAAQEPCGAASLSLSLSLSLSRFDSCSADVSVCLPLLSYPLSFLSISYSCNPVN